MSLAKKIDFEISENDYLERERMGDIKHEYSDGYVYAMAGASENHGLISQNISREIGNHLIKKKSSCDVLSADMKVRISRESLHYFYPDIAVFCNKHEHDSDYFKHAPVIIIEVLSRSTRKNDLSTKKLIYFNIPSLEEYVVIEQDLCEITVFRKKESWQSTVYFLGDEIKFSSINVTIAVEDIYYHVKNDDMEQFMRDQDKEENL